MALPDTSKCRNNVGLAAKIFAEYGDFIRMVIRYKVKNEAQADDLFQDFFLSLVVSPLPAGEHSGRNILMGQSFLYFFITLMEYISK
jgi:DNA-directed RNA polymerase specialized sigma24 family protein